MVAGLLAAALLDPPSVAAQRAADALQVCSARHRFGGQPADVAKTAAGKQSHGHQLPNGTEDRPSQAPKMPRVS